MASFIPPRGFGVTLLKHLPHAFTYLPNQSVVANATKGIHKWGKPTAPEQLVDHFGQFGPVFPNFKLQMKYNPEFSLYSSAQQLHSMIYRSQSPVSSAMEQIKSGAQKQQRELNSYNAVPPSNVELFQNASLWFKPGERVPTPIYKGIKRGISLGAMYVIIAVNEVVNNSFKDVNYASPISNSVIQEFYDEVLANLQKMIDNASSDEAKKSARKAFDFFQKNGHEIETVRKFLNYESFVPNGSQISYHFSGGYMHHGTYLESSTVVEVLNMDTESVKPEPFEGIDKTVNAFITISNLYDFIKRTALSNESDFYIIEYDDQYPLEVLHKRAFFGLGRFSGYHSIEENCESFASWVFSNNFEATMCIRIIGSKINGIAGELTLNSLEEKRAKNVLARAANTSKRFTMRNFTRNLLGLNVNKKGGRSNPRRNTKRRH